MTRNLNSKEAITIFSALSNPLRIKILYQLREKPLKPSQLAKSLKTSIQNLQRNLNQMMASNLITKNVEGEFVQSSIGEFVTKRIPALTFLLQNMIYFRNHTLDGIHHELLQRLGELRNYRFYAQGMELWETAIEINQNVRQFAFGMAAIMPTEQYKLASEPIKKGASYKIVFGRNSKVDRDFYDPIKRKQWNQAMKREQIQERFVEFVPITLQVTETTAAIDFANKKTGQSEIQGLFVSTDPSFRKWCMDLFSYYWNDVVKIKPIKIKPTE